jgi:hypothetical protein
MIIGDDFIRDMNDLLRSGYKRERFKDGGYIRGLFSGKFGRI